MYVLTHAQSLPRFSSILSAYGIALADIAVDRQQGVSAKLEAFGNHTLREVASGLVAETAEHLRQQVGSSKLEMEVYYNCFFASTTTYLMIKADDSVDLVQTFLSKHEDLFGFILRERDVRVESVRVRGVAVSASVESKTPLAELKTLSLRPASGKFPTKPIYFEEVGYTDSRIVPLRALSAGEQIRGPAIIYDETQTILVEPTFQATALSRHIVLEQPHKTHTATAERNTAIDPIQLRCG